MTSLFIQHRKVHPLVRTLPDRTVFTVEGPIEVAIMEDTINVEIESDDIEVDITCP